MENVLSDPKRLSPLWIRSRKAGICRERETNDPDSAEPELTKVPDFPHGNKKRLPG